MPEGKRMSGIKDDGEKDTERTLVDERRRIDES